MSEMIYEEQKQEALPELPVYEKIHKELMDLMENPMNEYYDLGFPAIPPEQSLADAYQKVMEKLEQSIHIAEEEEKAAHSACTNTESDPSCVVVKPLYLTEDTWQEVEDAKAQADRFYPLGADDPLLYEIFINPEIYLDVEKKLQGIDEIANDTAFMQKYQERHEKLGTQIHHINQALQTGEQNIVPQLKEIGASFCAGYLEMMREYIKVSYERASKTLQETYGAELSEQFLQKTPGDALLNVPGVERSFLAEKEALLAQHKKWNPAYTMRTAKKLAEQWQEKEELSNALLSCDIHNVTSAELTAMAKESMERCEKEIAKALQKHAPDIQNLPSAALRQNAAARIAKSAVGSVRVGQQEQNKEKSR